MVLRRGSLAFFPNASRSGLTGNSPRGILRRTVQSLQNKLFFERINGGTSAPVAPNQGVVGPQSKVFLLCPDETNRISHVPF